MKQKISRFWIRTEYGTAVTILYMKLSAEKKPELTFLQVRMEKQTVEKAKEQAKKSGLSLSLVVRKLLEDYVNDPQPKLIFG